MGGFHGFRLFFAASHSSFTVFKVVTWFVMVLVGFQGFQGSFLAFNVVSWLSVGVHGFSR